MSGSSVVPYQQKKATIKTAAIDNVNDIVDPINFSFCKLDKVDEIKEEEPRPSPRKNKTPLSKSGKSRSKGLRLNNNNLASLDSLITALGAVMEKPLELEWLDLSFNEFTDVPAILLEFKNLKILYLHGNQIKDIAEIEKLAQLKSLIKLSLHGNPVDKPKDYRPNVLAFLPCLKELDFSVVTKCDGRTASVLNGFKKNKNSHKKKAMDDED